MSVTVYPYLADPAAVVPETAPVSDSAQTMKEAAGFREALSAAERNLQARAIDALIRRSETGSVDVATVQRILGFTPTTNPVVVNSKVSDAPTADKPAVSESTGPSSAAVDSTPQLENYFAEAAALYGVDIDLLKAVAKAESNFDPSATSKAGAMGIMQLMPDTASGLGIKDAYDAHDNILGGAKLLAEYIERYDGDLSLALAAYNAGPGNVDSYNGVPPFEETQNYVKKVLEYYGA